VRLHKIIQTVTDADSLHLLMRADKTPGSLINFPFFHVDNFAQRLQASAAVPAACKLFAVCLFDLREFITAMSQTYLFPRHILLRMAGTLRRG
jgi:hypothetical protein